MRVFIELFLFYRVIWMRGDYTILKEVHVNILRVVEDQVQYGIVMTIAVYFE